MSDAPLFDYDVVFDVKGQARATIRAANLDAAEAEAARMIRAGGIGVDEIDHVEVAWLRIAATTPPTSPADRPPQPR